MMTFGLIGQNISYSKSPFIHRFMAPLLQIPFKYDVINAKPEDLHDLVVALKKGEYQGFNVTIPYKEDMLKYVDRITKHANRIGAINTLYYRHGFIYGDNTDYEGFKGLLKLNKIHVKNKHVYILGSGGAAKAVYTVLKDLGATVTVVSRTPHLSDVFSRVIGYQSINIDEVDIFVNATPIGTYPNIDDTPINLNLVKQKTVIDLIYNPVETSIVKHAKKGVGGLDMLIIQALHSEMIWFDKRIKVHKKLVHQIKEAIIYE